jgi:secreted PhoX family phosphatase
MSTYSRDGKVRNTSGNEPFSAILERQLSRRRVMHGGLTAMAAMMAGGTLTACSSDEDHPAPAPSPAPAPAPAPTPTPTPATPSLAFESLPNSMTDAAVVPAGYVAHILGAWGTPLNSAAAEWKSDGTNTSADQANATGMHHDGLHYFPLNNSSSDGLLAINFEYIDENALHPNGPTLDAAGRRPAEEVRKEINAHGAGVYRVRRSAGRWSIVKDDAHNRRFTSATVMDLAGPVAGSPYVITPFSATGLQTRGTNNNCGNGYTPWGTYLTCEENWAGYFRNSGTRSADQDRLGVGRASTRYRWDTAAGDASEADGEFARWNVTPTGSSATDDYRNEANTFGYVVEIDPYDASTRAVKRTALGRFAHEGAWPGNVQAGQPVSFYSGDDSRFEYVYRFVSEALWDPADAAPSNRLATGAKYLDRGTLYVARFNDDGTGAWLALREDSVTRDGRTLGAIYGSLANIILNTRGAADAVGATPMDRPEWTTVNPLNGDIYLTLTNNNQRTADRLNAANPRANNVNGHIIRWSEDAGRDSFQWDIFVFGSDAGAAADTNRSGLTALNQFASPDGMSFDSRGILWFQTDNGIDGGRSNAVAQSTNDQMLAVVPAAVRDAAGAETGIDASNQALLRRFFVGPNACEVTGVTFTPDNTSVFINLQHPANWPYDSDATLAAPSGIQVRPRSSTVVIQKADGGAIGV